PAVRECVVLAREGRLVAYLGTETLDVPELRAFLGRTLPEYMLPSAFVALSALPRTPNGKVDRRALPEPERARGTDATDLSDPSDPIRELLAGIWAEVVG